MDLYQLAGPTATVIASATAAYVTWKFQSKQVEIAKIQAATARNKLKFDQFEERHKLYEFLGDYIEAVMATDFSYPPHSHVNECRIRLSPIKWMFGPEVWSWVMDDLQNKQIVNLGILSARSIAAPGAPADVAAITAYTAAKSNFWFGAYAKRDALFERYLRLDF